MVETLTCNFSTTTSLEKTVSEITIMESVKSYFEFITIMIVCGIPEITLEGTPQDWEKVLNKARGLKEYKLEWWISQLEPLLEEFVKASKGTVNQEFGAICLNVIRQSHAELPRFLMDGSLNSFLTTMKGKEII